MKVIISNCGEIYLLVETTPRGFLITEDSEGALYLWTPWEAQQIMGFTELGRF